jgi:bacterioferritin-associated ferredoxin
MFICICHAVTDSTIRQAVRRGASSFRDLSFETGCGTQCGSCVSHAREVMNGALAELGLTASEEKLRIVSGA